MIKFVLQQYGFNKDDCIVNQHDSGLINDTWLVGKKSTAEQFILQKINNVVFKSPENIAHNISLLDAHFNEQHPGYLFIAPIKTADGRDMFKQDDNYFRIFPFVKGSHTINVVQSPEQAYEAAKQFSRFTKLTGGLDISQLRITLPDFHNLSFRYQQFENVLISGDKDRLKQSGELIKFIQQNRSIVGKYEYNKSDLIIRCTHHDTKISNVLFDKYDKGICVIDLDTVMPGYFISDVGDMMRTYLSPVNEEDKHFSAIEIRPAFYEAIVDGYNSEMGEELTDFEKKYFHFAGKFMIYMQAIRFLTDHINSDIYYGAKYEDHNFVRAGNQITLLQRLQEFNPY